MPKRLEKKVSPSIFDATSCEEKHIFPNIELRKMVGINYNEESLMKPKIKNSYISASKNKNQYCNQAFSLGFNHRLFNSFRGDISTPILPGTNYKLR